MNPIRTRSRLSRAFISASIVSAATLLIAPAIEAQRFQDNDGGVQQREGRRGPGGRERDPAERLEERVNRLTQELRLSPRQANRVRAIFQETRQRMESLRDGAPQGREARQQLSDEQRQAFRNARREIRWDSEDRLHQALNCEQRDALRRLQRQRRFERRSRNERPRAGQRGNRRQHRGRKAG